MKLKSFFDKIRFLANRPPKEGFKCLVSPPISPCCLPNILSWSVSRWLEPAVSRRSNSYFPYAYDVSDIKTALDNNALQLVLHNLPAGDWDAGERGIACLPDRVEEFRLGVAKAIEYATALEVTQLNCLAGKAPAGVDAKILHETFVSNLRYAATELKKAGLKLLIEPINTFDIPGFYLSRTDQAIAILDEVGADNAFLQYDIYHAQRMEGELANTIQKFFDRIAHIQLADNPGRNEPGTGEIRYEFLFGLLDRLGYAGYIGCEYKPLKSTEAGIAWMDQYEQ